MAYVLLLTACINPDGMPFTTLSDKEVRRKQYLNALNFYLESTSYPIVFTENSDTDISRDYTDAIKNGRLEILTFKGNNNKTKGKGYGESIIIEYALNHSKLISSETLVVKITGRLMVKNITAVLTERFPLQKPQSVVCAYNSDFSFPDSRLFIAPISFLREFLKDKEQIDDSIGVFFEHILSKNIINGQTPWAPFWTEPAISGCSGTTGKKYVATSTKSREDIINYKLMALYRYRLFKDLLGHHNFFETIACQLLHTKYYVFKKYSMSNLNF